MISLQTLAFFQLTFKDYNFCSIQKISSLDFGTFGRRGDCVGGITRVLVIAFAFAFAVIRAVRLGLVITEFLPEVLECRKRNISTR